MSVEPTEFESAGSGLRHYLEVIRRRKWLLLGVTAVCVAIAVVLSEVEKPVYRAETKIVIGQGGGLVQPGFANSIQPYTATMSDLLSSNIVATRVIRSLGLNMSPHALLSKVSTSINPQTAVVAVFVDDTSQQQAVRIDQRVAVVFSQIVRSEFGQSATGTAGAQALTAKVFDPAHPLPGRVAPRPTRNVVIALVLGLILGLVAAFLREHFDTGLRTREDIERAFGLPVIGQVPFTRHGKEQRNIAWSGRGETAEAFRAVRANLQYLGVQRPLRSLLVTSASPEQGKTTVAANLALTIARWGGSVVVVDADLRRPRLEQAFGVEPFGPGLTSVLVGAADLREVLRDHPLPSDEGEGPARLAFVPSGPLPPNPSELLASAAMTALLDRLAAEFEYVVVDSPPVLVVADALELARNVDGVTLVVRRGQSSADEARELRAVVDRLGINLVGVVMSDAEPVRPYGSYGDNDRGRRRPSRPQRSRRRETAEPELAGEEVF